MSAIKRLCLWILAAFMVGVGILHFVDPEPFSRIVPPPLPALPAVYVSGVFEILGCLGILVPRTRKLAAWGLVALYVAVFPANIYMAVAGIQLDPANPLPEWGAWVRLPFQVLFIAWAWWFTREPGDSRPPEAGSPAPSEG